MSFGDDRDDFWNIEKLVPKKKGNMRPFVTKPIATDYSIGGDAPATGAERRKLTVEPTADNFKVEERSYTPEGAGLIRRITIRRFADRYDFYGNFRKAALIYYDYKTEKCDFAPYYSYMPQYSQLTSAQKNYYFYWRDMLRRGKYVKSDYSYIYLYAYEILNLPDKISPKQGLGILCRIWREYREALPRIDSYFSVWVQDYCMVYGLSCPMECIGDFIFDVIEASDFKEFYLSDPEELGTDGVETLVAYLSYYDWRRGKFCAGDNAEIYKKHMQGAMRRFIAALYSDGRISDGDSAIVTRDAFAHSLCTHAVKCKLEIEYIKLSGDEELRQTVTGAVRYTENKLRALFGIKSRLAIKGLADGYRRVIDGYFDGLFAAEAARRAKEQAPEYERLYDAPDRGISTEGADEIERASWVTTARLVVDDGEDGFVSTAATEEPTVLSQSERVVEPEHENRGSDDIAGADTSALRALLDGKATITDDAAAERINLALADYIGDVVLEYGEDGYRIIEDYREEIEEWLSKTTR